MTAPTLSEMYEQVNTAIYTILQAPQSFVSIDGRQYSFQDLTKLREMRAELRKELADSGDTSIAGGNIRPFASGYSIDMRDF